MKTKNARLVLGNNQRGMTLAELLVVMVILVIVTMVTVEITMRTVSVMVMGQGQASSQNNVERVIDDMANDIIKAGAHGNEHIHNGSGSAQISFTKFGENLDAFVTGSDDMEFDSVCYKFFPPQGANPNSEDYVTGYIKKGAHSGLVDNAMVRHSCLTDANMYRVTDNNTDIRELKISYCRPRAGATDSGDYDCTSYQNVETSNGIIGDSQCVWLVKIAVTYARRLPSQASDTSSTYDVEYSYQTAVAPRNIYTAALKKDSDRDTIVDCCDEDQREDGTAVPWCPHLRAN
jgi:prepilin-type N-terminal cleavage/methylation domain-containing protein